jgi:hypothetical protein
MEKTKYFGWLILFGLVLLTKCQTLQVYNFYAHFI